MQRKNIFVSAIYISPPTSMGGNTKILIEMINNLSDVYNFIVFTTQPQTFIKNVGREVKYNLHEIDYPYSKFNLATHMAEILYSIKVIERVFLAEYRVNESSSDNLIYSASDFGPDVFSALYLKKKYGLRWIASLFLFIPSPFTNVFERIGFPVLKYSIYYIYQRLILLFMFHFVDQFIITNDLDRGHFPERYAGRILAVYGGVNPEQMPSLGHHLEKAYDCVFCGRLHPQKGLFELLDIWSLVVRGGKHLRLVVIGNGDTRYEDKLYDKAKKLGISETIDWVGYKNGEEKYLIYAKSRVFLHTTVYDNNGMVAAEALCSGLPIILFNLVSLGNLYNENSIKVKRNSVEEYAQNLRLVLDDKSLYNKLAPNELKMLEYRKYWAWSSRMKEVGRFIANYEKHIT